jgi:hypothetical protein
MSCSLCHQDHDAREHIVSAELVKLYETPEVLEARRRLTDAMHAMHVDQRIRIDTDLAQRLEAAWNAYDAALLATGAVSQ